MPGSSSGTEPILLVEAEVPGGEDFGPYPARGPRHRLFRNVDGPNRREAEAPVRRFRTRRVLWARRPERDLVADTHAFLSGHLVERAQLTGAEVPVWAWTNLLAHGAEPDLRCEISCGPGGPAPPSKWHKARSYLAGEVLRHAQTWGSLAEVQRAVLVPLELELASRPEVEKWKPARWVVAVQEALARRHPVGPLPGDH
jgi:hypothetical protein